jgi:hypothetical protein
MIEITFYSEADTVSSIIINTFNICNVVLETEEGVTIRFNDQSGITFEETELIDTTCKELYLAIKDVMTL